jgi:hypothetical protein
MPLPLTVGQRSVDTVFDLLGRTENDLTYSLGWALSRSEALTASVLHALRLSDAGPAISVSLQEAAHSGGFTDIEIRYENLHLIVEAKKGWALPASGQIERYSPRLVGAKAGRIVVISEATRDFATRRLPALAGGVPILYLSWAEVITTVDAAHRQARRHNERRLLAELRDYLRGAVTMQDPFSTWTYCVSVNDTTPYGWSRSFRDFVDAGIYFHPYGVSGWPKRTVPNFLAFRWAGAVQRIHHVDGYRVIDDLSAALDGVASTPDSARPHAIYTLGPAIPLATPLPNGASYRAVRLWVAVDLLLTSKTLKDAHDRTQQRRRRGGENTPD